MDPIAIGEAAIKVLLALAPAALDALRGGKSPEEAIAAARAAIPPAIDTATEDRERRARLRSHVPVLRSLAARSAFSAEERAAVVAAAAHVERAVGVEVPPPALADTDPPPPEDDGA